MLAKRVLTATRTMRMDHSSGEITASEDVNVVWIPREPPYVKMYIEDLSRIVGQIGRAHV